MKAPELLLPAGGLERMRAAYDYGADAVYAGSPRYSLRARNNEFAKLDVLEQGIKEAHERNKKFFLTVNTLPHNSKLKTFVSDMEPLIAMKPDALIMADPGLIMTVREKWPEMPIHLSVQANTTNYWGVKFWQNIGVERIILSRELSMEEIAEIRPRMPRHRTRSLHPRRIVYRLLRPLPALRLFQPPRPQPRHLHQLLPLGLQSPQRH